MRWFGLGLVGVVVIGSSVACGPVSDDRSFFIEGDFDAVEVRLSNGDLSVQPAPDDRVFVDVDFGGVTRPNGVDRYVEDSTLILDYDCTLCGGDLIIGVPSDMPVRADLHHGDLELIELQGAVDAEVHAGSVTGIDLACDTTIFNHAGSVELSWAFRPEYVDAEARLGAVALEVPAGGYAIDTQTTFGVVRLIDVFDDSDAGESLSVTTRAGEISIEGY